MNLRADDTYMTSSVMDEHFWLWDSLAKRLELGQPVSMITSAVRNNYCMKY